MRKVVFFLFALLICQVSVFAQPRYTLSLDAGYMMTNNSEYSRYNSATFGMSASVLWGTTGDEYWKRYWNYPSFGFKASFSHIPNSPAGDRLGLVGVLCFDVARRWEAQIGVGFSGYTRPYSITGDTTNIFIGSLLNCLIDAGIAYRIDDRFAVACRVLHTSNGMLMRPNQGLNFVQLDIAYNFGNVRRLDDISLHPKSSIETPAFKTLEWGVAFSGGLGMSRNHSEKSYYPCYDVTFYYQKYTSPVFAFGGAVDLWYNGKDWRPSQTLRYAYALPIYFSAMGMMEFFWGPISLKAGFGPVLLVSHHISIPYYERVGAYYNFGNQYVGVALNAHGGRIEFIEWTIGHRF